MLDRRFLITGSFTADKDGVGANVGVHAGLVDFSGNVHVDPHGHYNGGVEGKVNIDGVQVGGKFDVSKDGHLSGGASVGVGIGSLGGVNFHVNAGPNGVKAGVGASLDVGPLHGGASFDVDQNGKTSTDTNGHVDIPRTIGINENIGAASHGRVSREESVNVANVGSVSVLNGRGVSGNAIGHIGMRPALLNENIHVDGSELSDTDISNSIADPASLSSDINVVDIGVSKNASRNVEVRPASQYGQLNENDSGVSGSAIGHVAIGPGFLNRRKYY